MVDGEGMFDVGDIIIAGGGTTTRTVVKEGVTPAGKGSVVGSPPIESGGAFQCGFPDMGEAAVDAGEDGHSEEDAEGGGAQEEVSTVAGVCNVQDGPGNGVEVSPCIGGAQPEDGLMGEEVEVGVLADDDGSDELKRNVEDDVESPRGDGREEADEGCVVRRPDAVVEEDAVVVHLPDAFTTRRAVMGSWRFDVSADLAPRDILNPEDHLPLLLA